MRSCPSCAAPLPTGKPCPRCEPGPMETQAMSAIRSTPSTRPAEARRFEPGQLLGSRYRVISRLGKGGMGEVFRADDIVLGQQVALKFLPEAASGDANLLKRFYDEVRIARQITHANVCRVYDIGEVDGQPYLSMEYIDGEDMGSLLRRIGRLPSDKATEFARKMCAGLAAAHAKGVLHRDLKPGNIMVDGRGELRITDFGLAAFGAHVEGAEVRNGTPAYMAPEQLEGTEVSVRSDLYALGLVLYEMFTGKVPHPGDTLASILNQRKSSSATNPSKIVADIDPVIEKAILRCLNPDPRQRPASALSLAASLPGGDPLAMALAAGETPSPELVAASGSHEGCNANVATFALGAIFVLLAIYAVLVPKQMMYNRLSLPYSPEVLEAKARDMARELGMPEARDTASSFHQESGFVRFYSDQKLRDSQWTELLKSPPYPTTFWYRQHTSPIAPRDFEGNGKVTPTDPPLLEPGMAMVRLDLDGRLLELRAIPQQDSKAATTDWSKVLKFANLDESKLASVNAEFAPPVVADARVAWTGKYFGAAAVPIQVEAASLRGVPVYFRILWPWDKEPAADGTGSAQQVARIAYWVIYSLAFAAALFSARANMKAGRGDFRGAARIGFAIGGMVFANWALEAHHVGNEVEVSYLLNQLGIAAGVGLLYWMCYVGLEPWVRRQWPEALVTWSRVMQGKWLDPTVGRDLLFGVLGGLAFNVTFLLARYVIRALGLETPNTGPGLEWMSGVRNVLKMVVQLLAGGIDASILFFLVFFLMRMALKKSWLAGVLFVIVMGLANAANQTSWQQYSVPLYFLVYLIVVFIMLRLGFLALMLTLFISNFVASELLTTQYSAWYGQSSWFAVALTAGLAILGFRLSMGRAAPSVAQT